MHSVLVAGSGKIGRLIGCLLAESGDYKVYVSDINTEDLGDDAFGDQKDNIVILNFDAMNTNLFSKVVKEKKIKTVISSLPYYCNPKVAENAKENNLNYFDLTEDVKVTEQIRKFAKDAVTAFVPQSGLAPGFISIATNDLIRKFDSLESVQMRVGALPIHSNNFLKYALNWSTEGLINEYGNDCIAIKNGKIVSIEPLEGLETIEIDGLQYEAFNTSGGLGSLANTYVGKVKTMNYKTVRYPGHCEKMRLLMNDLKLNEERDTLKRLLENVIPRTPQDVVMIYVTVKGYKGKQLIADNYFKKVYPATIANKRWSAIQVTTASSVCAVVDLVVQSKGEKKGLILQEEFKLSDILSNQFGRYYAQK